MLFCGSALRMFADVWSSSQTSLGLALDIVCHAFQFGPCRSLPVCFIPVRTGIDSAPSSCTQNLSNPAETLGSKWTRPVAVIREKQFVTWSNPFHLRTIRISSPNTSDLRWLHQDQVGLGRVTTCTHGYAGTVLGLLI